MKRPLPRAAPKSRHNGRCADAAENLPQLHRGDDIAALRIQEDHRAQIMIEGVFAQKFNEFLGCRVGDLAFRHDHLRTMGATASARAHALQSKIHRFRAEGRTGEHEARSRQQGARSQNRTHGAHEPHNNSRQHSLLRPGPFSLLSHPTEKGYEFQ